MNTGHKEILEAIRKHKGKGNQHSANDAYLLSGHRYYDIRTDIRRKIAKEWLKEHRSISAEDFIGILDSLFKGESYDEKMVGSYLLDYHSVHRGSVRTKHLDQWLNHLVGWAEIDGFCHNVFTAEELLDNWKEWSSFIRKLSVDRNINKRRAALVYLVGPTHRSDDQRLKDLSFEMIDVLKHETPILITKAISWLLRDMSRQHKKDVSQYLKENEDSLPKIAIRETRRKLTTGRK